MQGKFGLDFADGCGRLHLKGAPFFVGDVLDKHHSTKELEPFSCFSDDVTFEIQDYTKNYGSGNKTINGYKVFYKLAEKDEDPDPILTITYQIGYSTLYVIQFPDYKASNKSVKRVTAIAMPKGTSGKFKNPFTSYANWGNYRFLTQNGASTVYPGNVSGLIENTWSHGGSIDYIKNVISSTDRDEQYKIY
ncbi:hypothetical protein NYE48_01215 [Paenibacillus sp. FSL M7-1455]|uniref:hypothetical protein n=1 Tax=Paenibacillus sp. FSL M7-1455 TaxID=2975316 RepID=UPI0030FC468D